jgi:hypothetical protein
MRSIGVMVSATLVAAGVAGGVGLAPPARAYNPSINGTYTVTVIGDWARTRQVRHEEPTTTSTWKITSSCSTAYDCTGQVVSDQGWTAPLRMYDGLSWYVQRDIPNWETCPDGTSFAGKDYIMFYPANPDTGENALGSPVLAGRDRTLGPSGVCGANQALDIDQPMRLDRIG